jgi:hypothetical protein
MCAVISGKGMELCGFCKDLMGCRFSDDSSNLLQ